MLKKNNVPKIYILNKKELIYFSVVITSFLIFFINSINYGLREVDPYHYGLIFGNAIDFLNNKQLYKYIPEQYGVLTTIINACILFVFGKKIIYLIFFYNLIYFLAIFLLFLIFYKISKSKIFSAVVFLLLILSNPVVQLIWPNYLAFLYLVLAIFFLYSNISFKYILIGFCFSLIVLTRENNFFAIFLSCIAISFIQIIKKDKFLIKNLLNLYISFFFPILIFFIYLYNSNLLVYWNFFSIDLVNIYLKYYLFYNHSFELSKFFLVILKNNLSFYFISLAKGNFRNIIFLLINVYCLFFFLKIFFYSKKRKIFANNKDKVFLILMISLLQLSNTIHIVESFRLSSGFIVGVLLFSYTKNTKKLLFFFIFLNILVLQTYFTGKSQHPKYLFKNENLSLLTVESNNFIYGLKFSPEEYKFYENFSKECVFLKKQFDINIYYNFTPNSFLGYLCELDRKQTFPFFFQYADPSTNIFLNKRDNFLNYTFDGRTIIFDFVRNLKDINIKYTDANIIYIKKMSNENNNFSFKNGFFVIIYPNKSTIIKVNPFKGYLF